MKEPLYRCGVAAATFLALTNMIFAAQSPSEPTDTGAKAINWLGIDLLRQMDTPDRNFLLSPYSIQSAMAMAYAGADGGTRDEMARVLHYPKDEAEVHRSFAALRKALNETLKKSEEYSRSTRGYGFSNDPITLTIANRLFGQSSYDFRGPFLALVKDTYEAPFEPLDFVGDPGAAAKHINKWVEDQTKQRIRDVIPENALNRLTRLVLVNAIYLKAPWAEPFESSATKPGPFHLNGGKSIEVPMMHLRHELAYCKAGGFSVLELPYSSYDLRFLIFLPEKLNEIAALRKNLTPDMLAGRVKWETRDVTLSLPRFKLEPPMLPLGNVLRTLGMKSAFDVPTGSANFNRIAPRRLDDYLAISEVFHKTFLKLDEKGTEAAAATALHVATLGIHEPTKPLEVKVDHPFLFAIQHQPSGTCLFLGILTDPR